MPLKGQLLHKDTFAKFFSEVVRGRNVINKEGAPFFRHFLKAGKVVFEEPHGCWKLLKEKLDVQTRDVDLEDFAPVSPPCLPSTVLPLLRCRLPARPSVSAFHAALGQTRIPAALSGLASSSHFGRRS